MESARMFFGCLAMVALLAFHASGKLFNWYREPTSQKTTVALTWTGITAAPALLVIWNYQSWTVSLVICGVVVAVAVYRKFWW